MAYKSADGQTILTLDIPQREGKEGLVGTFFGLFLRMGGVIADANFKDTDARPEYMTHFLISMIADEDIREKIRDDLIKDLEAIENAEGTNETKAKKKNICCIRYIGKVSFFVDKYLGVSVRNKVGYVRPQIKQ